MTASGEDRFPDGRDTRPPLEWDGRQWVSPAQQEPPIVAGASGPSRVTARNWLTLGGVAAGAAISLVIALVVVSHHGSGFTAAQAARPGAAAQPVPSGRISQPARRGQPAPPTRSAQPTRPAGLSQSQPRQPGHGQPGQPSSGGGSATGSPAQACQVVSMDSQQLGQDAALLITDPQQVDPSVLLRAENDYRKAAQLAAADPPLASELGAVADDLQQLHTDVAASAQDVITIAADAGQLAADLNAVDCPS